MTRDEQRIDDCANGDSPLLREHRAALAARDAEIERLRSALKPFLDAIVKSEADPLNDGPTRLKMCRNAVTLYEFGNARHALQQSAQETKP